MFVSKFSFFFSLLIKIVIEANIKIKKRLVTSYSKKLFLLTDVNFETEIKAYFYPYRKNSSNN